MTKPPERVMVIFDPNYGSYVSPQYCLLSPDNQKHFYTLEKPMEQKTENLTTEEAWAAMARGECVKAGNSIQRICRDWLQYWDEDRWLSTSAIGCAPYSIVPDPSKPKDVERSEYEKDREALIKGSFVGEALRTAIVGFIERNFEKRKP